jgi:hypothetical protein
LSGPPQNSTITKIKNSGDARLQAWWKSLPSKPDEEKEFYDRQKKQTTARGVARERWAEVCVVVVSHSRHCRFTVRHLIVVSIGCV